MGDPSKDIEALISKPLNSQVRYGTDQHNLKNMDYDTVSNTDILSISTVQRHATPGKKMYLFYNTSKFILTNTFINVLSFGAIPGHFLIPKGHISVTVAC